MRQEMQALTSPVKKKKKNSSGFGWILVKSLQNSVYFLLHLPKELLHLLKLNTTLSALTANTGSVFNKASSMYLL